LLAVVLLLVGGSPLRAQTEPECPKPKIPDAASTYYLGRAHVALGRSDFSRALLYYTCALETQPNDAPTYANRGFAYAALGDSDSALGDYTKALELDEALTSAYLNRGTLYTRLGNFGLALTDFDLAVGLNPNDPIAYNNRGVVHAAEGNFDLAIADFQQAIQLNPDYATPYAALGAVYSALAAQQYQKYVDISADQRLPAGTPGEVLTAVDDSLRTGNFAVWLPLLTPAP
ncbi:MAG TPA: tetratricopeptide repeat protein, partial [Phototrophicaceae bacterium]|nr:tetratricopeptide repeat protein [Phototrophicaceae bacterium]